MRTLSPLPSATLSQIGYTHRQYQHRRHPRFRTERCFIPVVKPHNFSCCRDQIQRLARALALDIHFVGCDMRASRHARTFLQLPPVPEAGIHTYVRLTHRELAQAWQRRMLKNEPLVGNLSVLDRKAINWLRCSRWVRLIDTDKKLVQHWSIHNGSKIKFRTR